MPFIADVKLTAHARERINERLSPQITDEEIRRILRGKYASHTHPVGRNTGVFEADHMFYVDYGGVRFCLVPADGEDRVFRLITVYWID